MNEMGKRKKMLRMAAMAVCSFVLLGCSKQSEMQTVADEALEDTEDENIVVGFSQLGAESDWRRANTESMKETFTTENGYRLIFDDGQQKQANQITAIRTFIQEEVD